MRQPPPRRPRSAGFAIDAPVATNHQISATCPSRSLERYFTAASVLSAKINPLGGSIMLKLTSVALLALPVLATGAVAADGGQHGPIRIKLSGAQEDPTVITDGQGTAVLRIQGNTIAYRVQLPQSGRATSSRPHPHRCQTTRRAVLPSSCAAISVTIPWDGRQPCPKAPGQLDGVIDADGCGRTRATQGVPARHHCGLDRGPQRKALPTSTSIPSFRRQARSGAMYRRTTK